MFSFEQENDLVAYIVKCVQRYYGLTITDVRELAFQYALKLKNLKQLKEIPSNWKTGIAGWKWYYNFMKRHRELALRTPEQTSLNRVKAFCKDNVEMFFENFVRTMDSAGIPYADGHRIYNMDETGFSTVPSKVGKVIALKGSRRVGKIESAERGTMITMALTVSADGNSIPPFFLFPRKNWQTFFLDNTSTGTAGTANESGWMTQADFVKFMRHFIRFAKPSREAPVLLLLDNHTSHLSVEALDLAVENGVHLLSFPPHCSHKMQPLDVSVYASVKAIYRKECDTWMKKNSNTENTLEIRHIAGLVSTTLDKSLSRDSIKSGFRTTGIHPFNPNIFSDADYVTAVEANEEAVRADNDLPDDERRQIVLADMPNVGVPNIDFPKVGAHE